MQLVSSRIWTRVAVSISNDDNHYTTRLHEFKSCTRLIAFHVERYESVNEIVWLEFELAYYDVAVQNVS